MADLHPDIKIRPEMITFFLVVWWIQDPIVEDAWVCEYETYTGHKTKHAKPNNPGRMKNAFKKVLLSFGLRPGPTFGNSAATDVYGSNHHGDCPTQNKRVNFEFRDCRLRTETVPTCQCFGAVVIFVWTSDSNPLNYYLRDHNTSTCFQSLVPNMAWTGLVHISFSY